ncbi:Disks large-associated protein 5 [Papilio xuthus]|uniref:Disks large-associated protein 5 n=1 Tax=Papilio xuthus TaxID=66420 RepID=A0A194PF72_PAPXU|nr:Disks large-associated protein 5 [Papilio xuthus]
MCQLRMCHVAQLILYPYGEFNLNNLYKPKKVEELRSRKQYKPAPKFSIQEGVLKRTQLLNNKRKSSRFEILDATRHLEMHDKEKRESSKKFKEQERIRMLLEWKKEKQRKKQESVNKLKPFVTGTVKFPKYYVPPSPLPKIKSKDKQEANKKTYEFKNYKPFSTFPKKYQSNFEFKQHPSNLVQEHPKKAQIVSKMPISQTDPSQIQTKRKGVHRSRKDSDNKITKKERDDIITKFRAQLDSEVHRILQMCKAWDKVSETTTIPVFAQELVLAATGQGRLLVSQKMEQFRSLVDTCNRKLTGARQVTTQDLHGFWDMVYIQVEDINKRFEQLEQLMANNWKENSEEKMKPAKKGRTINISNPKKKPVVKSRIRQLILDKIKNIPVNEDEENVKTLDAGFLSTQTPTKTSTLWPSTSKNNYLPAVTASSNNQSPSTEQVEDINKPFGKLKANNCEENTQETMKPAKRGKTIDNSTPEKKPVISNCISEIILEAKKANKDIANNVETFDAGWFSIQSPKMPVTPQRKTRQNTNSPILMLSSTKTPFEEQNRVSQSMLRASLIGKSIQE